MIKKMSDYIENNRFINFFILLLIFLNIMALMLETVQAVHRISPAFFKWFEIVSVLCFSVEYILRIISCTTIKRFSKPVSGRIMYALTPLAFIDLLAILPFYLPFIGIDLRSIRVVRLLRFFRIAKIARYSKTLQTFGRVIAATKEQLITTLFFILVLLVLSSSLIYFVENDAQPDSFSSIPAALWWGIATLTTVGYGDIAPVTVVGKIIASIVAILGIGLFVLPAGILGSAFMEEIQNQKKESELCPHCGKEIKRNEIENTRGAKQ